MIIKNSKVKLWDLKNRVKKSKKTRKTLIRYYIIIVFYIYLKLSKQFLLITTISNY